MNANFDNAAKKGLKDAIPSSLDGIIRANRDICSLYLSTPAELGELPAIVELMGDQKHVSAVLNEWRFICLNRAGHGGKSHFLTGIHTAQNCYWATSEVVAVDLERGFVLTQSGSIYQLGTKGIGEPGEGILLHICAQFHNWGFGKLLGVPHIFY